MIGDILTWVNCNPPLFLYLCLLLGCGDPPPASNVAPAGKPVVEADATSAWPAARSPRRNLPRLLSFSRDNCLPCEIMAPWVDEIGTLYKDAVDLERVNLDRAGMRQQGIKWRIRAVPTQIYLSPTGREVYRHQGIATVEEMEGILIKNQLVPRQRPKGSASPDTAGEPISPEFK